MTQNLLIASFFFFFYFILFSDKVLQHLKGHDHYVQGVSWDPLNIVREGRERKRDFLTWHVLCCVRVVDKNRSSFQNVFPRVSSLSFSLVSKLTILKKNEIQMGWKQFNKSRCQKRNGNFSLLTFSSSFSRLKKKNIGILISGFPSPLDLSPLPTENCLEKVLMFFIIKKKKFLASQSCDRTCRIFSRGKKKRMEFSPHSVFFYFILSQFI